MESTFSKIVFLSDDGLYIYDAKVKYEDIKMEDGQFLNQEDKNKMEALKKELAKLKAEHKKFAGKKGGVSPEERELWRINSQRTNQIYIEIKDLRFKNVIEAGKG